MRLWHYPSFDVYRSWTIFHRRGDLMAREVTWDRPHDVERLSLDPLEGLKTLFSTKPSVSHRDARIDPVSFEEHMKALFGFRLPVHGLEEVVGVDGESFGLELSRFLAGVRLRWWCDGPKEWRELTGWHCGLRSFLREQLGEER
jgi:hypothetical protein